MRSFTLYALKRTGKTYPFFWVGTSNAGKCIVEVFSSISLGHFVDMHIIVSIYVLYDEQ